VHARNTPSVLVLITLLCHTMAIGWIDLFINMHQASTGALARLARGTISAEIKHPIVGHMLATQQQMSHHRRVVFNVTPLISCAREVPMVLFAALVKQAMFIEEKPKHVVRVVMPRLLLMEL
jgi:hypothetical protein